MAEPAQRRTDPDGGKFYEHPARTEDIPDPSGVGTIVRPARYVSVTQVLSVVNKPALVFWSANLAARRAMDNLPKLLVAAMIGDCGRAAARTAPYGCGVCVACIRRWVALFHHGEKERRAREGTAAHDVLERWTLTGEWIYTPVTCGDPDIDQYVPTHEQMAPYIASLKAFVADFGLTPESWVVAECTVWKHDDRWAGTLDGIVDVEPRTKLAAAFCARIGRAAGLPPGSPVRIILDAKSREGDGPEFYAEHPLQLAPYRWADTMMPKGRNVAADLEQPMLATDGAAILQVRPDGYTLRPVVTDGRTLAAFRAALALYRWHSELGDFSTQVGAFPLPDDWKAPTWERATLADGTLCPCAGCDIPGDGRCRAQHDAARPLGPHTKLAGTAPAKATKRAPAKRVSKTVKAAAAARADSASDGVEDRASAILEHMRGKMSQPGVRHTIPDDQIPF